MFVYSNESFRLGVLIQTPLTCVTFQEKKPCQGLVASAARRFPNYGRSRHNPISGIAKITSGTTTEICPNVTLSKR